VSPGKWGGAKTHWHVAHLCNAPPGSVVGVVFKKEVVAKVADRSNDAALQIDDKKRKEKKNLKS
jgi:Uri superfamily endonuclease